MGDFDKDNTSSPIIKAESVGKMFGSFCALADFNLQVAPGECLGLLGPNGAGKSTFISMLYGALAVTSGRLTVMGLDPARQARQIKRQLGVILQDNCLDEELTVEENLRIYASFHLMNRSEAEERITSLLDYMALTHKRDQRIRSLSGGMKRRLAFVRSLMHDPELVILDEPTTGLDPAVRHLLWNRVEQLKEQGKTVILTTHYMDEAEILCDRLVIMNRGRVLVEGAPDELIRQHTGGIVAVYRAGRHEEIDRAIATLAGQGIKAEKSGSAALHVRLDGWDALDSLHRLAPRPLLVRPSNLEDLFLKLTGRELSHDA